MSHHWEATERRLAQKANTEHNSALDADLPDAAFNETLDASLLDEITLALQRVGIAARDSANGALAVSVVMRKHKRTAANPAQPEDLRIGRIVATLLDGRIQINAHALAFAAGLDQVCMLGSASNAAARLGVTRAAMTKAINKWCDELGIRIAKFSRPERTRENCAKAQRKLSIKRTILCFK